MKSGFFLGLTLPLLLAMAVNAYGLTTFGKSNTGNAAAPQQPQQPGMNICMAKKYNHRFFYYIYIFNLFCTTC